MNHIMDGDPTKEEKERWAESIRRAKDNLKQLSEEEQSFVMAIIAEVEKLKATKLQSQTSEYGKEEI
jgi:predicted metalloprotease